MFDTKKIKVQFKNRVCQWLPNNILFLKGCSNHKSVALTFDDGPHPLYTQPILKILKMYNIKATFFLNGIEVEKYPQLAKEIAGNEHEIGNHNYSHRHLKMMNYNELCKEIQQTNRIIKDITGITTKIFRPPYGKLSLRLLWYMFIKKMTLVLWSLDSNDSYDKSSVGIINRLKVAKAGDIILLHGDYPQTVEALPSIIKDIKGKSLDFISVSEVMKKRR